MTDLDQRLIDLLDSTDLPSASLDEDLARGRAHLRRRRATVGAAALGTAVVLASAWALGPGGDDGDAARTTTPVATEPTSQATPSPEPTPTSTPSLPATIDPLTGDVQKDLRVLRRWNDVLAENLDPGRAHLQEVTRTNWNVQGGTAYGSKYGWANAGESGLGMLQLSISAAKDVEEIDSPCTWEGIPCPEVPAPAGAERVQVGHDGGRTMVVVERTDGQAVALTFDPLFGNNSLTPVSGSALTADDLVAAALDLRLTIR